MKSIKGKALDCKGKYQLPKKQTHNPAKESVGQVLNINTVKF